MNIGEFAILLEKYAFARKAKGCSTSEILSLEARLKVQLPEDYKLFLSFCGHGVTSFLAGSSFVYEKLLDIRDAAEELVSESGATPLPDNSIVFVMHQGYQFYFLNKEGAYYYMEGRSEFEKRYSSFMEFFLSEVNQ